MFLSCGYFGLRTNTIESARTFIRCVRTFDLCFLCADLGAGFEFQMTSYLLASNATRFIVIVFFKLSCLFSRKNDRIIFREVTFSKLRVQTIFISCFVYFCFNKRLLIGFFSNVAFASAQRRHDITFLRLKTEVFIFTKERLIIFSKSDFHSVFCLPFLNF